jgi:hypothetical protein
MKYGDPIDKRRVASYVPVTVESCDAYCDATRDFCKLNTPDLFDCEGQHTSCCQDCAAKYGKPANKRDTTKPFDLMGKFPVTFPTPEQCESDCAKEVDFCKFTFTAQQCEENRVSCCQTCMKNQVTAVSKRDVSEPSDDAIDAAAQEAEKFKVVLPNPAECESMCNESVPFCRFSLSAEQCEKNRVSCCQLCPSMSANKHSAAKLTEAQCNKYCHLSLRQCKEAGVDKARCEKASETCMADCHSKLAETASQ